MPSFLPDSNCMVAAVSGWHPHHRRASYEIRARLERGDSLVAAAPAVVEAYSVLTRLPAAFRLAPSDAWTLLYGSFVDDTPVVALDAHDYLDLLRVATVAGVAGGRIYDAVIFACARKARATALVTFNWTHFAPFSGRDVEIVVPGEHVS